MDPPPPGKSQSCPVSIQCSVLMIGLPAKHYLNCVSLTAALLTCYYSKTCVTGPLKIDKIRKSFSKFYHRHSELIVKYNIGLKTLLQQGISEPIFYGDLVYRFKRIVGKHSLSDQLKKIIKRYKKWI